jgi:hypothetical protein
MLPRVLEADWQEVQEPALSGAADMVVHVAHQTPLEGSILTRSKTPIAPALLPTAGQRTGAARSMRGPPGQWWEEEGVLDGEGMRTPLSADALGAFDELPPPPPLPPPLGGLHQPTGNATAPAVVGGWHAGASASHARAGLHGRSRLGVYARPHDAPVAAILRAVIRSQALLLKGQQLWPTGQTPTGPRGPQHSAQGGKGRSSPPPMPLVTIMRHLQPYLPTSRVAAPPAGMLQRARPLAASAPFIEHI